MIFLSIHTFRKALLQLSKAKKSEYASIRSDIAKSFLNKTSEEIFSSPDMINQNETFKVIKLRIANTNAKFSKRDGYRMIYLVNNQNDMVCLLYVYPKKGSLQQINISDKDLKQYLIEFTYDFISYNLVCHNILDDLSINKKQICNIEACEYEQLSCED